MVVERLVRVNYASSPLCLTAANVARDFDRFHLPLDRLHNRLLHGPGILTGLELSIAADRLGIFVSAGAALDVQGRTIVLADAGFGLVDDPPVPMPVPVRVPLSAGSGAASQALTIEFSEEPSLPINPAEPAGCKQIEMRPRLRLLAANSPLGPDAVILGNVTIGDDGKVAAVGPASRSHSQVTTAGLTIDRVGPASFTPTVAAVFRADETSGLRVTVPDGLRLEGSLTVSGKVHLGNAAADPSLDEVLASLRKEIDTLKQLQSAPTLTTIWIHGAEIRVAPMFDFTIKNHSTDGFAGIMTFTAEAFQAVNTELWLSIPTPVLIRGRPARLRRIFVLGDSNQAEIVSIMCGIAGETYLAREILLQGDFDTVSAANTFVVDSPPTLTRAVTLAMQARSLVADPNAFEGGSISFECIGVEFES